MGCFESSKALRGRGRVVGLSILICSMAACSERFGAAGIEVGPHGGAAGSADDGAAGSISGSPSPSPTAGGEGGGSSEASGGAAAGEQLVCTSGTQETRVLACGVGGTQAQARECDDEGQWGQWRNAGPCNAARECSVGETVAVDDGPCGYCGTEPRDKACTDDGQWGEPGASGMCVHASCSASPGDERPGFIDCRGEICSSPMNCCAGSSSASCQSKECPTGTTSVCDGPEDCETGEYCIRLQTYRGVCSSDAGAERRCHVDADCDVPTPYCLDKRSKTSGHFGHCVADLPP